MTMTDNNNISDAIQKAFYDMEKTITELRQYITSQSIEIALKNKKIAELEKQLQDAKK